MHAKYVNVNIITNKCIIFKKLNKNVYPQGLLGSGIIFPKQYIYCKTRAC